MNNFLLIPPLFAFCINIGMADVDISNLSQEKCTPQGLYLSAKDAYQMVKKNADEILFIDVRMRPEVEFNGMTDMVDANIPFLTHDVSNWDSKKKHFARKSNPRFPEIFNAVLRSKNLNSTSIIIIICRMGKRSAKAAILLYELGYNNVYTVVDGFEGDVAKSGPHKGLHTINGWKYDDLPWSYDLDKRKMYFEDL